MLYRINTHLLTCLLTLKSNYHFLLIGNYFRRNRQTFLKQPDITCSSAATAAISGVTSTTGTAAAITSAAIATALRLPQTLFSAFKYIQHSTCIHRRTMSTQQQHAQSAMGLAKENSEGAPVAHLPYEERLALCLSVGECVTEEDLKNLLRRKTNPICYDGFEPSGRMHLAQGILKAINVNKLTKAGCTFIFWVADWFGLLNNKMDGSLDNIQLVGKYFIEVWKAAGMDMANVKFLWASENINKNSSAYWLRVMEIARTFNISRLKRCSQIMGRAEGDDQPAAQILYPCMQCADIFELNVDICQLGLDQRKVNMLAREYCDKHKISERPVILSHEMLPGLTAEDEKMSKSNPNSAIFMDDSPDEVNQKIKKAFCPPNIVENNRCVSYVKKLVFPKLGSFSVKRSEKNGGDIVYNTVEEFIAAVLDGSLHPGDLKPNLAAAINEILDPVRQHFETDPSAKDLLEKVRGLRISR